MTKLVIWTPQLDEHNGQNIISRAVIDNYPSAKLIEYQSKSFSVKFLLDYLLNLLRIYRYPVDTLVYIVVSRSTLGFFRDLPILLLSYSGKRIIAHTHGSDLTILMHKRIIGLIARYVYRSAEVIVPSKHMIAGLKNLRLTNVHLVENFFSGANGCYQEKPEKIDQVSIVWNSNIVPSKGIIELCESMTLLGVNYNLTIFGKLICDEGWSYKKLKELIGQFKEKDNISYCGYQKPEMVNEAVSNCDMIVLPSSYSSECQPLAIIAGMCLGKRVILLDTPALNATAHNYPAIFVKRRDAAEISDAIIRAAKVSDSALKNGMAVAVNRFSRSRFDSEIQTLMGIVT